MIRKMTTENELIEAAQHLCAEVEKLRFAPPVNKIIY